MKQIVFKQLYKSCIYLSLCGLGISLCVISFFWIGAISTIFVGLGTGILTSTIVAFLVNRYTERLLVRQRENQKQILLNRIQSIAHEIYRTLIEQYNIFIERIDPVKIEFKYRGGGSIIIDLLNYKNKCNLYEYQLGINGSDIQTAFKILFLYDYDFDLQNSTFKDAMKELFLPRCYKIRKYMYEVQAFNLNTLFSLELIDQEEYDLLLPISEYDPLWRLYEKYTEHSPIEEFDPAICSKFFDALANHAHYILKSCERLEKVRKKNDDSIFHQIDIEAANNAYRELYSWDDDMPAYLIHRNIFM